MIRREEGERRVKGLECERGFREATGDDVGEGAESGFYL